MGFFAGFYNACILAINGTIGTIRTWALYGRSPTILAYSAAFVAFQVVLFSIGMSMDGRSVISAVSEKACIFDVNGKGGIGESRQNTSNTVLMLLLSVGKHLKWIAVFMDSGPLALVAWRTRQLSQQGIDFPLVKLLYRDCSIALMYVPLDIRQTSSTDVLKTVLCGKFHQLPRVFCVYRLLRNVSTCLLMTFPGTRRRFALTKLSAPRHLTVSTM